MYATEEYATEWIVMRCDARLVNMLWDPKHPVESIKCGGRGGGAKAAQRTAVVQNARRSRAVIDWFGWQYCFGQSTYWNPAQPIQSKQTIKLPPSPVANSKWIQEKVCIYKYIYNRARERMKTHMHHVYIYILCVLFHPCSLLILTINIYIYIYVYIYI